MPGGTQYCPTGNDATTNATSSTPIQTNGVPPRRKSRRPWAPVSRAGSPTCTPAVGGRRRTRRAFVRVGLDGLDGPAGWPGSTTLPVRDEASFRLTARTRDAAALAASRYGKARYGKTCDAQGSSTGVELRRCSQYLRVHLAQHRPRSTQTSRAIRSDRRIDRSAELDPTAGGGVRRQHVTAPAARQRRRGSCSEPG